MKIPKIEAPQLRRVVTVIGAALTALALMLVTPAGLGTAVADHPTPHQAVLDVSSSAAIDANGNDEVPDTGSFDEQLNLQEEACWNSGYAPSSSGCVHHRVSSSYPADPSWPGGNR
jgi:hypothetical protein